ncbi:DHA2 family efflux MFS transporter permease subunit [Antrihabitans stalactiti]|uniref:DHA2 family efflux MFS transporter permease subunit n=1 Tax=Antrihabitans stalactiti TaxID=2584121 RepID=A0A848KN67_9NOCA|nr:DHA2 family efflux MFS transporter permease subunit [Antrihabitans stalactiti]NMN97750.1 DHA2 family efflux MFS transporter permease subunit [Antrihabitans stalactiti]
MEKVLNPWRALGALCLGFFMILLDMTIVSVANVAIMNDLRTDINNVIWVTSAYLLAYAVPLLITGRLGDRFGPKNIYLGGLVLFTIASLFCGLSQNIEMLITARVFQGFGAAMMTPQPMAVITRIFPPDKRGAAMGLWGSVAGVASLVGPIAGGLLVDGPGWQWIFYVNVPVGLIAFGMAWIFVPALETHEHRFDFLGIALSAIGLFCLVFGLQEGNNYDWSAGIWLLIAFGVAVLIAFIWYQSRVKTEPLLPLSLFKERNFSLANVGITAMAFAITAMFLPAMFYAQAVRGFSPTKSAFLFAPMAIVTGVLAPFVGKLVDKTHPRIIPAVGFASFSISLVWFAAVMQTDTEIWKYMAPIVLMGVGNACIWAPLAATATHDLPPMQAGAGAGVYNTTRQVGSVLGSAAVAALIVSRLSAHGIDGGAAEGQTGALPPFVREAFNSALAESLLLPAGVLVIGFIASMLFASTRRPQELPKPVEDVAVPAA